MPTKYIPVIVMVAGGVLGLVGAITGLTELVGLSVMDAIASGIVSGLTASGAYSAVKNLQGAYPDNEYSKKEQLDFNG